MTVFAYHTPQIASPINDRRGGTYRIGSDSPDPITIYRGWDLVLYFAFRDHIHRPFMVTGRTVTARIFNNENTQVWSGPLVAHALTVGAAQLVMSNTVTSTLLPGLYSMVIEYADEQGRVQLAQTTRSLPRFVVSVIDQTTVNIND